MMIILGVAFFGAVAGLSLVAASVGQSAVRGKE